MAKLIRTALGCSARRSFCERLQQLPYGSGILVVPNSLLKEEVRQHYAGIEVMGMDELANKLLNNNGYVYFKEISRRSQELLVQDFVRMVAAQHGLDYFGTLGEKQGFIKAMTSLITELSASGLRQEEIGSVLSNWHDTGREGQKNIEIVRLYHAYRNYLKQNNWFDLEGKYRLALKVLENPSARIPWQQVYFCDFYHFDSLKLEFIKSLAEHVTVTIGMSYEKEREQVFGALQSSYTALEQFCEVESTSLPRASSASCLFLQQNFGMLQNRAPLAAAADLRTYVFADREAEMRWVLTQVKQSVQRGTDPQQILVAVRKLDNYTGLRLLADEYGLPVTLPLTFNLAVQPLAELLRLLLAATSETHDGAEAYLALLRSDLAKLLLTVDGEALDELREENYFTTRSAAQRQVKLQVQKNMAQVEHTEDTGNMEYIEQEDAVLAAWDEILERMPITDSLTNYIALVQQFIAKLELERVLGRLYAQDKLPLTALSTCLKSKQEMEQVLGELLQDYINCEHAEESISLHEFMDLLTEALSQRELTLLPGRRDGVRITEVFNAQGMEFDEVYLLGMREGEFPCAGNENWIYNDRERAELTSMGLELATTAQAYAEDNYFFAAAASAARKKLVLTYADDDGAQPSPYLTAVQKLYYISKNEDGYEYLQPRRPSLTEKPCASLAEVAQDGARAEAAWLEQTYGAELLQAAAIDGKRNEERRSASNGVLVDSELQQKVRKKVGSQFSASALEIYAACPFAYLGTRVWKQSEFAPAEDELQPVDEGNLLHAVLAAFLGAHLEASLTQIAFDELEKELREVFVKLSEEYLAQGMIKNAVLWAAEKERLYRLLHAWLVFEYDNQREWNYRPSAVEWDFSSRNGKPYALYLNDRSRVTLIGRIDRVDSDGKNIFITDYKRSASSAPSAKDLDEGFDVQLPLYLLAAQRMYEGGSPVTGGAYYVLKDGEQKSPLILGETGHAKLPHKERKSGINRDWQSFEEFCTAVLKGYIENIYQGKFVVEPRKTCSPYCALQDICRIKLLKAQQGNAEGGAEHA